MKRSKILSLVLVVGLSLFLFAGCGSSSDESASSSSSSSSSSTATEETVYSQDFTLVNDTGIEIYAVYVSPTGEESWGDDILEAETLPDGSSVDISFDSDVEEQYWDIMVADSEGTTVTWTEIDLFSVSEVDLALDADGNPVATFN
ncbi:hypothetical protein Q5O14_17170 [Eubacteriaceae bacterium ES2]|nr:hypothetical protein Q5O14_17170 [Eubacteriaceae bacterium ES2]